MAAQGIQTVQREGLYHKPETVLFVRSVLNLRVIPVNIAGLVRDQHRVLRIGFAQTTRTVDGNVHPQYPLDILESVLHQLALRTPTGVFLFFVDAEFTRLYSIEFD